MPLSIILIVVWVLGIPAYFAYKSVQARALVRSAAPLRRPNRVYAGDTAPDATEPDLPDANERSRKLALIQTSCGYVFQRYRLRWVWWEAVRPSNCVAPTFS